MRAVSSASYALEPSCISHLMTNHLKQSLMDACGKDVCARAASSPGDSLSVTVECIGMGGPILSAHAVAAFLTERMYPAGWLSEGLLSS